jgi:hypothetical protein
MKKDEKSIYVRRCADVVDKPLKMRDACMLERAELINKLADRIEQELRDAIATEPYPFYTNLDDACDFCFKPKTRLELKIVIDPREIFDESRACDDCIKKEGLVISNSDKALDYEARTIAIMRIRQGTYFDEIEKYEF